MGRKKLIITLALLIAISLVMKDKSYASELEVSKDTEESTKIQSYTAEDGSVYTTTGDLTLEDIMEIERLRTEGTVVYSGTGETGDEIDFSKVENEEEIYVDETKVAEGYVTFSAGVEKSIMESSEGIKVTYKLCDGGEEREESLLWYNAYESRVKLPVGRYELVRVELQGNKRDIFVESEKEFFIEEGKDAVFIMNIGEKIKEERTFVEPVVVYETSNIKKTGYIFVIACSVLFLGVIAFVVVMKKKNNVLR